MTWTDQRPMAFAEADMALTAPPQEEGWEREFELWSQPRPVEGSMWSTLEWWWERSDVGVVVTNAQGITASGGRVLWDSLWQVQLEVWLLSDTYLELSVALKARGEGVQAGVSAAFKVVLPHTWVSASVPVKQNAEVGYLDLEAFVEIWPLLCFYAQAHDIHIQHLLGSGSLDGELPAWDVEDPAEIVVPGADIETRKRVDSLLNEYDAGAATSLEVPKHLWELEQEGFDYLFSRLASWPKLTTLSLESCHRLKNVDGLAKLTKLTTLDLESCHSLKNVDGLAKLPNLTTLDLWGCASLENVEVLAKLTKLTQLDLWGCDSLENVEVLAKLTKLTILDLGRCQSLKNAEVLAKLTNLTELYLNGCYRLKSLGGLAKLTKLTTLDLSECKSLRLRYQRFWTGDELQAFLKSQMWS